MRIGVICGEQYWAQCLMSEFIAQNENSVKIFMVERSFSIRSLYKNLKFRLKKYGIFKVTSQILLQFYLALSKPWSFVRKPAAIIDPIFVDNINSKSTCEIIENENIDVLVCLASSIMKKDILSAPKNCAINLHPGINPQYRGAGGNFWAIFEQDWSKIGCTIHRMDEGIDTGKIIDRVYIQISEAMSSYEHITYESVKLGLLRLSQILRSCRIDSFEFIEGAEEEARVYGWYGLFDYLKIQRILKTKIQSP